MKYKKAIMYVDGCAKGNPGPAGAGAVMTDEEGQVIFELCKYLGKRTNSEAEYESLILGLEKVVGDYEVDDLVVRSDSEFMVRQMNGEYQVRKPEMIALKAQVDSLVGQLKGFRIEHIPRERNREADRLSNEAVMGKGAKKPGRYISPVDVDAFCTARCKEGKFSDERCTDRGCRLYVFMSKVLAL